MRDEVVFHEGDPADTVHLISSGRAVVRSTTRHGQRVTLAVLGPGDAFGELALLDAGTRRSATVAAIEPLVTHAIYEADFHRLRRVHPQLSEVIIALLSERVRLLDAQLLDALYLPADLRVRKRVAELAERYEGGGRRDGDPAAPGGHRRPRRNLPRDGQPRAARGGPPRNGSADPRPDHGARSRPPARPAALTALCRELDTASVANVHDSPSAAP